MTQGNSQVYTKSQRRFPWWILILGLGCFGVLCIAIAAVGVLAYFRTSATGVPAAPVPVIIEVSATPQILPTAILSAPRLLPRRLTPAYPWQGSSAWTIIPFTMISRLRP